MKNSFVMLSAPPDFLFFNSLLGTLISTAVKGWLMTSFFVVDDVSEEMEKTRQ